MSDSAERREGSQTKVTRRGFCKAGAAAVGGAILAKYLSGREARAEEPGPLPRPVVTGKSTEICLNSRISYHSGLSGTATDQQISNVLWAAGKAPVVGSYRTIYLKTKNATYIYHPEDHSLEYYSSQTVSNAFRIDYDRELDFDAGVSYMLALPASVSLWTGTQSQLGSCPQQSDLNFGIRSVPGLTDELVAVSSDGSLPNPATDGPGSFERVVSGLALSKTFLPGRNLTLQQLSQILWAGYGCSAHWTTNSRAGLTVPSWVAEYFLTRTFYVVWDKVWRYCSRQGSNLATRDHRIELVKDADVRDQVASALPGIPQAPCYILLCLTQSGLGVWYQRLETGLAAGGILLQGAGIGLGCNFRVPLSGDEQQNLQQIAGIPATDFAHAVVAVGPSRLARGLPEEKDFVVP
jgi:hypothetical protein